MSKQLISLVVPVYNEERNIQPFYAAAKNIFSKVKKSDYEIIFVNDGSQDDSTQEIVRLQKKDKRIRLVDFSRNFGKEVATTAGLHSSTGDAVIMIDADLQHPIELIPEFIEKWRAGSEVVVGVRRKYGKESLQKRLYSWLFYKILNSMAEVKVIPGATDYRLLDRLVVDEFNRFSERNRMTRGLIDWLGFRREYIFFTSAERVNGTANYSFKKLFKLAIDSFVSLSLFPLRLAGWLGIIITTLAGVLGLFMFIEDQVLNDPLNLNFSGPAALAVINMFLVGIILMSLGLIALYIANIHSEVINRPLYVTRKRKDAK